MDKKAMWSLAAKNGLILSLITVVIVSLTAFFTLPPKISIILSVVKFASIISVLYYFMKQYSESLDYVSYGDSFRYGLTICFLSSIVCTLFSIMIFFYVEPENIETIMEQYMTIMEISGMEETMDYDTTKGLILKIMPISVFISYMILGLIYPAIIANFTKKDEIFPTSQDV